MSKEKTKNLAQKIASVIENFLGNSDEAEMKIVYTADQTEINFPDLAEADAIEPGATATINDEPANGEFVDAEGNTMVFENGTLVSITEPSEGEEETDDEMVAELQKQLDVANAKIVDLTEEVENLKKDNETAQKEVDQARKVVREIEALQSEMIASINLEGKTKTKEKKKVEPKSKVAEAMMRIKESRKR